MDWLFYGALERLLKAGPMGKISEPEPEPGEKGRSRKKWRCEKEAGLVDREVTVKRLNLNVVTPADTTKLADMDCKLEWLGARQAGWGRPRSGRERASSENGHETRVAGGLHDRLSEIPSRNGIPDVHLCKYRI